MSRRRSLSDEERALWTGVARSIKPLRPSHRAAEVSEPTQSAKVPIKVPAKSLARAETSAPPREARPENVPEKKTPALAPLGRRLKQRVARGREPIDARLDLHGFTQTQAHAALLRFLRRAQADGVRMVLVVTGKGTSKGGETHERGVLKRQVPLWLSLPEFRSLVVGFEDAHIGHGGAGALYVRLRRAQRSGD
jgi:DNA-nicking Smr family endonuclease